MASVPQAPNVLAYFVRHGETSANKNGQFRGHTDYPLDDKGKLDAQKLAAYFKPIELGQGFSSDLKRSEQTASTILDPKGMTATAIQALRPLDVGYLTGEKKSNFKSEMEFFQHHTSEKIPGGESIQDFRTRVTPHIKNAISAGLTNKMPSIVVAHSSTIHEVSHLIHGDHNLVGVKPGGIAAVYQDPTTKKLAFKALVRPRKEDSSHLG